MAELYLETVSSPLYEALRRLGRAVRDAGLGGARPAAWAVTAVLGLCVAGAFYSPWWRPAAVLTTTAIALVAVGRLMRLPALFPRFVALGMVVAWRRVPLGISEFDKGGWYAAITAWPVGAVLGALLLDLALAGRIDRCRLGPRVEAAIRTLAVLGCVAWVVFVPGSTLIETMDDPVAGIVAFATVSLLLVSAQGLMALGASTRRVAPSLAIGALLVLIPAGLVAALVRAEREPRPRALSPYGIAHQVRADLAALYPHWERPEQESLALWREHAPGLLAAAEACNHENRPCLPLLRGLRDMLATLRNGHTEVLVYDDFSEPPVWVRPVADGLSIEGMEENFDGGACGLHPGMLVEAIDGVPLDQMVERAPPWRLVYASETMREYRAGAAMLSGEAGTTVTLTVRGDDGRPCEETLARKSFATLAEERLTEDEETGIHAETLPEGVGYVGIDRFSGEGFVGHFDAALAPLADGDGLVLDLRGNGGGLIDNATDVTGRFLEEPATVGRGCYLDCFHDWCDPVCEDIVVRPGGPRYRGRLAVLIDEYVASAAELVARALCESGRATCFGRATMGETDSVSSREIPGGLVTISHGELRTPQGEPTLGRRLAPQVVVPLTSADLRDDRDPTLEAAVAWLTAGEDRHDLRAFR